jgi:hypothetical protein
MSLNQDIVLLAIRGALNATNLEEARAVHNRTAGNPEGVAAARALGDLSHNVYVPHGDAPAAATELLILDLWNSVEGLGKFFSDPQVQAGGAMMFASRDPVVWQLAPASGFILPTPRGRDRRFVGLIRGVVKSREGATAAFDAFARRAINAGRLAGQVSHQVFFRVPSPGASPAMELLGVDVWMDDAGMARVYGDRAHLAPIADVFSAAPTTSTWKQPAGDWVEW